MPDAEQETKDREVYRERDKRRHPNRHAQPKAQAQHIAEPKQKGQPHDRGHDRRNRPNDQVTCAAFHLAAHRPPRDSSTTKLLSSTNLPVSRLAGVVSRSAWRPPRDPARAAARTEITNRQAGTPPPLASDKPRPPLDSAAKASHELRSSPRRIRGTGGGSSGGRPRGGRSCAPTRSCHCQRIPAR